MVGGSGVGHSHSNQPKGHPVAKISPCRLTFISDVCCVEHKCDLFERIVRGGTLHLDGAKVEENVNHAGRHPSHRLKLGKLFNSEKNRVELSKVMFRYVS